MHERIFPLILRLLLSALVALVVAVGTVRVWDSLKNANNDQIARIAESESYAARSQLIRNVERMFEGLEAARTYWTTYGQLPRQQWTTDADFGIAKIAGVKTILWDDPDNSTRFARTAAHPVFDFRPDENQWSSYKSLLARGRKVSHNTLAGPFLDSDGRPFFEIYLVGNGTAGGGRLVAVVDARDCLQNLLMDESPGYAVQVFWGEVLLFERGEAARNIPLSWTREGLIKSSMNSLWRVVHTPTREFAESIETPAINVILILGLIISVLMATLTFENWRAYSRAHAAEVAERRLAELNRNLEKEIDSRTQELANRTADLETITDSVAHDLRNPLNAIATNVQLFEIQSQGVLAPEAVTTLKRIAPAVRQMAEILNRMLGLSVVANTTFERERLNMHELIKEEFRNLQASEPPPEVHLEMGELPEVDADESLVRMLLMNLLSNALKYTRSKQDRRITVDFESHHDVTVYRITDNGIGFDQRSAERMFVAFQRLNESKVADGIGLGLAIAARVIGRHDGRIWAEGIPGEQARFFFTLEKSAESSPSM